MPSRRPHNMVNFGPLAAKIVSLVWGTPPNFNWFLANVNYMLSPVRLSSVCLSVCLSVTLVHPTQAVQIFGNISTAFGTVAIR